MLSRSKCLWDIVGCTLPKVVAPLGVYLCCYMLGQSIQFLQLILLKIIGQLKNPEPSNMLSGDDGDSEEQHEPRMHLGGLPEVICWIGNVSLGSYNSYANFVGAMLILHIASLILAWTRKSLMEIIRKKTDKDTQTPYSLHSSIQIVSSSYCILCIKAFVKSLCVLVFIYSLYYCLYTLLLVSILHRTTFLYNKESSLIADDHQFQMKEASLDPQLLLRVDINNIIKHPSSRHPRVLDQVSSIDSLASILIPCEHLVLSSDSKTLFMISFDTETYRESLYIIDISNLASPVILSTLYLSSWAWLSSSQTPLEMIIPPRSQVLLGPDEDSLIVLYNTTLCVAAIDITSLTSPQIMSQQLCIPETAPRFYSGTLLPDAKTLLTANALVDVSNITSLALIGQFDLIDSPNPTRLDLKQVNSDESSSSMLGTSTSYYQYDSNVSKDKGLLVFLGVTDVFQEAYIQILQLTAASSSPSDTSQLSSTLTLIPLSSINISGVPRSIIVSNDGTTLFVSESTLSSDIDNNAYIEAIDISDPTQPNITQSLIQSYGLTSSAIKALTDDGHTVLYWNCGQDLHEVDVSNSNDGSLSIANTLPLGSTPSNTIALSVDSRGINVRVELN